MQAYALQPMIPAQPIQVDLNLKPFHKGQKKILKEAKRFNVACMGRRFGKTWFGINLLMEESGLLEGNPCAWFAPNYLYLLDVWDEVVNTLETLIVSKNKTEKRIKFVTGAILDFWSLDNPDAGRSRKYKRVIIDEAAMVPKLMDTWNKAIRPTLSDLKGDAWFFSTPRGFDDFRELFKRGEKKTNTKSKWPQWKSWRMPTSTNPFIDKDEIEDAKQELPELVFAQEYLANFVDFAGLLIRRSMLRVGRPKNPVATSIGVDLAIGTKNIKTNAYTAISVMQRDLDGSVYLVDVIRGRWAFNVILQMIEEKAREWNANIIGIEDVQFQDAVVQELMRTTSLPIVGVTTGGKDKVVRFLALQSRYEKRMIQHVPGLNPEYEDELLTFPNGEFLDMVDATVYAFRLLPDSKHYKVVSTQEEKEFTKKAEHRINRRKGFGSVR